MLLSNFLARYAIATIPDGESCLQSKHTVILVERTVTSGNDVFGQQLVNSGLMSKSENDEIKRLVLSYFSKEVLMKSLKKDEHFNTKLTPLYKWDSMGGFRFSDRTGEMLSRPTSAEPIDYRLLKKADEGYSSATAVCIFKEAARQIIEV